MEECTDTFLNALLQVRSEDDTEVDQYCFRCLQPDDCYVLILTKQPPKLVNVAKRATTEELMRLIVMNFENIESIGPKLLSLHEWEMLPSVVILDLRSFINDFIPPKDSSHKSLRQTLCFTIATLINYTKSLKLRLENKETSRIPMSITLLPNPTDNFTDSDIGLLINLYFYKNNVFENLSEVFNIALERINSVAS